MNMILQLASWVATPLGAVCAIAVAAGVYFFVRWVLAPPAAK